MTGRGLPADWPVIKRITMIVRAAPGGGLHRDELAERLQPLDYATFTESLMIAYRLKRIDFCRQYVVRPATERKRP